MISDEEILIEAGVAVRLAMRSMEALCAGELREISRSIRLIQDAERAYIYAKKLAENSDSKIASSAVSVASAAVDAAAVAYFYDAIL